MSASPRAADAIFVLAGRPERKTFGVELFRQGVAPRLLLSVGRFEWRHFLASFPLYSGNLLDLVEATYYKQRHFFVVVDGSGARSFRVPKRRYGTYSEIAALAEWVETQPVRSLILVSSGFHLRRCMAIMRLFPPLQKLEVIPVAVPEEIEISTSISTAHTRVLERQILGEAVKYLAYKFILPVLHVTRRI